MATIKVFSALGVKELQCFDTLENVSYDEDETIEDDGQLTVGLPIDDKELTRQNFHDQFPDY